MTAQYKLLGTLEVWHNGALVPVPSGRARVLLASLLLRANEVVSVDELVDRLWEGAPTESEPSEVELVSPKVRRSPGLVPRQLPPDLPWFSGRHGELRMLDGLLPTDGTAQRTVVVSAVAGTGGVGKTAFAVHWAHRVADRFPDGQLFINLRGYDTDPPLPGEQAVTQLLVGLGVASGRLPRSLEEQVGLYRSLLADRRMLLLLDNAATAEQVRPLIPAGTSCCVLITGRGDLRGLVALNDATVVRLDVLDAGDAHTWLRQVLRGTGISDETVAEPAELCGYLPLALRVAAGNLVGTSQASVDKYLVALKDGDRLGELAIDGDRQAAVRKTFQVSYQALADEPRRLFRLLGLAPGPDFSAPAAAALAGIPHSNAERLLEHLFDVHLVEQKRTSTTCSACTPRSVSFKGSPTRLRNRRSGDCSTSTSTAPTRRTERSGSVEPT